MADYQLRQALTGWKGDIASLLAEMKRQAGVRTDRELAVFAGVAQSTVAYWRSRGSVPEAALLSFERLVANPSGPSPERAFAARMVVLRLAEYKYQEHKKRRAKAGREVYYLTVAGMFHTVLDEAYRQLESFEGATGLGPIPIAARLLEDDNFLSELSAWTDTVSAAHALGREALSPPTIRVPPRPQ